MSLISENFLTTPFYPETGKKSFFAPWFIQRLLLHAMILLVVNSCTGGGNPPPALSPSNKHIIHARGFDIMEYEGFTLLTVHNPWQGAGNITFRYVLARHDAGTGLLPPEWSGVPVISVPVKSVICLSTTHLAMLEFIGESESVAAVSGGELIFNQGARERLKSGDLQSIGYDMNLDYERILEIDPDVILAYGVDTEATAWLDRLRKLGIKVVMIGEYLEGSPLAQAEWVKFIACLFEKQQLAAEKFGNIEKEYFDLARLASAAENKPVVMSGLPWRGSWFVPGGNSHFARIIADAGGRYLWEENNVRGNFPVDLEKVIEQSVAAEYWINPGAAFSLADIENTDQRLVRLGPFRNSKVFNNNARLSPSGGNDYWESGIVNPHLILRDLIHILHPSVLPGHEPFYFRQL
jgi:iron complex transport system substrate-binding protein